VRGLRGAVTALILVVAIVVIALIVVGFVFNPFGSSSSKGVNATKGVNAVSPVSAVGPVYLYTKSAPYGLTYTPGDLYLVVTISNRGPNTNIISATINGQTVTVNSVYMVNNNTATLLNGTYIPVGRNQLVIQFNEVNFNTIGSGPVNVQLVLANGQTIYITASVAR